MSKRRASLESLLVKLADERNRVTAKGQVDRTPANLIWAGALDGDDREVLKSSSSGCRAEVSNLNHATKRRSKRT
jgi:hypothetical protein